MDAIEEGDNDARFGQSDAQDRGAELQRDYCFLSCVIPDDQLRPLCEHKLRKIDTEVCAPYFVGTLAVSLRQR